MVLGSKKLGTKMLSGATWRKEWAMAWHRLVLVCEGVRAISGERAAIDITDGFRKRLWHHNARCFWDGRYLVLNAQNDFDPNGRALIDEFSDEICANVAGGFDGDIRVVSVVAISR
jgi:hypothetical protein